MWLHVIPSKCFPCACWVSIFLMHENLWGLDAWKPMGTWCMTTYGELMHENLWGYNGCIQRTNHMGIRCMYKHQSYWGRNACKKDQSNKDTLHVQRTSPSGLKRHNAYWKDQPYGALHVAAYAYMKFQVRTLWHVQVPNRIDKLYTNMICIHA